MTHRIRSGAYSIEARPMGVLPQLPSGFSPTSTISAPAAPSGAPSGTATGSSARLRLGQSINNIALDLATFRRSFPTYTRVTDASGKVWDDRSIDAYFRSVEQALRTLAWTVNDPLMSQDVILARIDDAISRLDPTTLTAQLWPQVAASYLRARNGEHIARSVYATLVSNTASSIRSELQTLRSMAPAILASDGTGSTGGFVYTGQRAPGAVGPFMPPSMATHVHSGGPIPSSQTQQGFSCADGTIVSDPVSCASRGGYTPPITASSGAISTTPDGSDAGALIPTSTQTQTQTPPTVPLPTQTIHTTPPSWFDEAVLADAQGRPIITYGKALAAVGAFVLGVGLARAIS